MALENVDEEWKETWKQEHLRTIAAFHNTSGGRMVIGRDDRGNNVGVGDPKDVMKIVSDTVRNKLDISVDVRKEDFDGVACVVVTVPKGQRMADLDGHFYRRVGNTTQLVTGEELKDLILRERDDHWLDMPSGLGEEEVSASAVSYLVDRGKAVGRIAEGVDGSDVRFDRYVPDTFYYEGVFRKVFSRYPREAVRELIVNAVVHRDYRKGVPVTVSVHPDRMVVASKGDLPEGWTVETLLGDHDSDPRNRTMARVFHDAGYVENWAQGIRKVVEGCRANGNPDPVFSFSLGVLKVSVNAARPLDRCPPELIDPLPSIQAAILEEISKDPHASASRIAKTIGSPERTVYYNIQKLVEKGIIVREGKSRSGQWKMCDARSIE